METRDDREVGVDDPLNLDGGDLLFREGGEVELALISLGLNRGEDD